MKNNYSVYQHVTPDGMYYFGQTQNVEKRWEANGCHYKGTALQPYIEQYGWDNIQHIVLFKDQTKENTLWIEDFLITTAREDGVCINKQRSGNISREEGYKKQYYEQNKEQMREQHKQYYEQNKEQMREQHKQYYEQNKEQQKQYREKNKDKKQTYDKQYYEEHRDKILEQKRQYRERKKLEQQLKEVQTTLF